MTNVSHGVQTSLMGYRNSTMTRRAGWLRWPVRNSECRKTMSTRWFKRCFCPSPALPKPFASRENGWSLPSATPAVPTGAESSAMRCAPPRFRSSRSRDRVAPRKRLPWRCRSPRCSRICRSNVATPCACITSRGAALALMTSPAYAEKLIHKCLRRAREICKKLSVRL